MMPSYYDGCSLAFSLSHTLNCCKGGLVTKCHNEVRDAVGDLAVLTNMLFVSQWYVTAVMILLL